MAGEQIKATGNRDNHAPHGGSTELLEEYKKLTKEPGAKEPGRACVLGWELEYVCGGAVGSFIDQLLIRQLNDFVAETDRPLILDCGANIGFSVLHYKDRYPKSRIIAFEPDPQFVPLLRRNLERNGAGDVRIVDAAVWVEDGKAKWHSEGIDGSRLAKSESELQSGVMVRTVDLAKYIDQPIDLLKMDIEGDEYQVIPHLGNLLGNVRNICVECHVDQSKITALGKLLQCLSGQGFNLGINSFGPWRDLIRQPEILPDHWGQYLILAGWRKSVPGVQDSSQHLPYIGAAWLEMESELATARYEVQHLRTQLGDNQQLQLRLEESQQRVHKLSAELDRYQSSWLCRLIRKLI